MFVALRPLVFWERTGWSRNSGRLSGEAGAALGTGGFVRRSRWKEGCLPPAAGEEGRGSDAEPGLHLFGFSPGTICGAAPQMVPGEKPAFSRGGAAPI